MKRWQSIKVLEKIHEELKKKEKKAPSPDCMAFGWDAWAVRYAIEQMQGLGNFVALLNERE